MYHYKLLYHFKIVKKIIGDQNAEYGDRMVEAW